MWDERFHNDGAAASERTAALARQCRTGKEELGFALCLALQKN
jgi:hypothetical protein